VPAAMQGGAEYHDANRSSVTYVGVRPNVCFWPLADFPCRLWRVRFRGVKRTSGIDRVKTGRAQYAHDPYGLIAASHVVAVEFTTIAAANNYWR
jgi:Hexameric tyrosine-coordinated heme protein (HTHP)